jgi:hypothetical protein
VRGVLPEMFHFLLVVEHHPALCTKYLAVALRLDILDLKYEVFPLFTILFNHFLFNNLSFQALLILTDYFIKTDDLNINNIREEIMPDNNTLSVQISKEAK